jgi:hypothetical protein
VSGPVLSARVAYSPDYFRPDTSTLYGSIDAVGRHHNWRAFGHIGVLTRLEAPPNLLFARTQYDWRMGVGRLVGLADLELALSGGGPGSDYYDATRHSKTAVVGVAKFAF